MPKFKNPINCDGIPVDAFFPEWQTEGAIQQTALAKKVCGNCLARQECLDYALGHSVLGVWGGTTENERRVLRRKLNIIAVPVLPPTGATVL